MDALDARGKLLTAVNQLDLVATQTREKFDILFTSEDKTLYNSRNFPGGVFTSIQHDIQRLKQRIIEHVQ